MKELRYTYQAIQGSGLSDAHFRITDTIGDDRIAISYLEENARLVVDLMNAGVAAPALVEAIAFAMGHIAATRHNLLWGKPQDPQSHEDVYVKLQAVLALYEGGESP